MNQPITINSETIKQVHEIKLLVESSNVSKKEDKTYKACVILLTIISTGIFGCDELVKLTGYKQDDVVDILINFVKNKIICGDYLNIDLDDENAMFEIILCAMCGAGEIVRCEDPVIENTESNHVSDAKPYEFWDNDFTIKNYQLNQQQ